MIKSKVNSSTSLNVNESYEGETIEQKMKRVVSTGEPITDGAPIIYTKRTDGVLAEFDIRTDRWDIAVEAMDAVSKSNIAKRIDFHSRKEEIGGTEPIHATE